MKFFTNGTWRPRLGLEQVATPVGEACLACGLPVEADDCGVSMVHMGEVGIGAAYRPWHLACFRRSLGVEDPRA